MVVDPAEKMVGWHVLIETEIVKELRRSRLRPIIRLIPCEITQRIESSVPSARNAEFFNSVGGKRSLGRFPL